MTWFGMRPWLSTISTLVALMAVAAPMPPAVSANLSVMSRAMKSYSVAYAGVAEFDAASRPMTDAVNMTSWSMAALMVSWPTMQPRNTFCWTAPYLANSDNDGCWMDCWTVNVCAYTPVDGFEVLTVPYRLYNR